jgi:arylsulfatase A-like enzyme/tetratricopeptide (TPR) repeat protein
VNGPIVLVSVDSLRADRLAAYGYDGGRTPAIDALAADGVLFEHAYSHVPQTLPAHASLLTGRLPFETGIRDAAGYALPGSTRTVAEMLRDRGFRTAGVVSSILLRKETGIARGFTFFDGDMPSLDDPTSDRYLMRDGEASEQLIEQWLDSIGTSRAFVFLHIAEPHAPYANLPRSDNLSPYDGAIADADAVVGRLLRYLKAHQLYDRSTIILTSDHGEGLEDHGELGHGLLLYEEALRVPLIIKQPAGEGAQRRVAARVQLIDIVPTILDLAKAPGSSGLRGRTLTALLNGGADGETTIYAESLFGEYRFGWKPLLSIIAGHHQLLLSGDDGQLFDLDVPPSDRYDISAEHADVVADLRKQLAEFVSRTPSRPPTPVTETDRERFEVLGYVGVPATQVDDGVERADPLNRIAFVEGYRKAIQEGRSDWKAALDSYRLLTREEPQMPDLWLHFGRTAERNERHDLAVDAYRHVLALDPERPSGYLGAAVAYLRLRKLDDAALHAQAVADAVAADTVQKAEAHELLARVALNRKDPERARVEAEAAELADPNRPVRAFVEGRIALDQSRYDEAVEAFELALASATKASRPPLADLRVHASVALVKVGRTEDAEKLLQAELAAFPANPRARSALQALYRASGRGREAAALAQR